MVLYRILCGVRDAYMGCIGFYMALQWFYNVFLCWAYVALYEPSYSITVFMYVCSVMQGPEPSTLVGLFLRAP